MSVRATSITQIPRARGMIFIPGGTFVMGSDKHYREEAPSHRVTVDSFSIDEAPVTNSQFKSFVDATRYVTFAETPPNPQDYPGALDPMLKAGSLVFQPASINARLERVVGISLRSRLAAPVWSRKRDQRARKPSRRPHRLSRCRSLREVGRQTIANRSGVGIRGARRARRRRVCLGRRVNAGRPTDGQHVAG